MLKRMLAMGQFTTPQNRPTMHRAAPKEGESPTSGPSRHPMVDPTKKAGTISPPFMPQPRVMAVKRSFTDLPGGMKNCYVRMYDENGKFYALYSLDPERDELKNVKMFLS